MTEDALAAPDKFGTDQLFITQQMRIMPLPGPKQRRSRR
jgi:hypothetical protein